METIQGVPLRKYDPAAAREAPLGQFEVNQETFYLFHEGIWSNSNPERWLWTSSYTQQLYERLLHKRTPENVKAVLDELETDESFEFIANTVQRTDPEFYPLQEFSDALNKAKTEEERQAVMDAFSGYFEEYPEKSESKSGTPDPTGTEQGSAPNPLPRP